MQPLTAARKKAKIQRSLQEIAADARDMGIETHAEAEYKAAAKKAKELLLELETQQKQLSEEKRQALDNRIDARLLHAHLKTRVFEIEEAQIWRAVPVRYLQLGATDGLLLRPCSAGSAAVARAITELERLPKVLQNAKKNLLNPARTWTENAIYTTGYAEALLARELQDGCIQTKNRGALLEAAKPALKAVREYRDFLRDDLLPRSNRSPTWKPEFIEHYHRVHEWLDLAPPVKTEDILALTRDDERTTLEAMQALAKRIHPSGDLETVWSLMKEEAPPWDEVRPMAERYVAMAAQWLETEGSHIIGLPERFDYGTVISTPMARRILSFGGASYGPTLAGRISGYYVLTPIEEGLSEEDRLSRLRSYNPYWTHVISYHEWVGHNVQRAWAEEGRKFHPKNDVRDLYRSAYLSQAWSFYLEKLFEEHGYFDTLPYMEALKTQMARLQMRMWRIQRILTKLEMARDNMSFEQAVEAYVTKIGMEPTNAFIEVQRDSQNPGSPGREILGERILEQMWEEYQVRMGEHARLRDFHESLLSYGTLPLPAIRALMFGDL